MCRALLAYNGRGDIVLNGELLNSWDGLGGIESENVGIKYSTSIADHSRAVIMVNGVVIESLEIQGENLCEELALDFPLACSLPESRSELAVDAVAIAAAKEMISAILSAVIPEAQKIAVLNALYPVLEKMQTRSRSNKREDNLSERLRETFKKIAKGEMKDRAFLPNTKPFRALRIPDAIYLDSRIYAADLAEISGMKKCERFHSDAGYQLYVTDFEEESDEFIIEDGRRLVIDRQVYERQKDAPAAINVYLSNLDSTGQNKKEETIGRVGAVNADAGFDQTASRVGKFTPEKSTGTTAETEAEDKRRETIFKVIQLNWARFNKEFFLEFYALSQGERENLVRDKVLEAISTLLDDFKDKKKIMDGIQKIMSDFAGMFFDFEGRVSEYLKNYIDVDIFFVKEVTLYRWLCFFEEYNCEGMMHLTDRAAAFHDESRSGKRFQMEYLRRKTYLNDVLQLGAYFPLGELEEYFREYDEEYLVAYVEFMNNFMEVSKHRSDPHCREADVSPAVGIEKDCLRRADFIFRNKLMDKPVDEIRAISDLIYEASVNYPWDDQRFNLTEIPPDKRKIFIAVSKGGPDHPVNFTKIKYQNVPRSCRGYLMYILEGGEILNEKDSAENGIEQEEYQAELPLSALVQAKKEDEHYFQEFSGTPLALAIHTLETQNGIDRSKATRDIMHSAESQIVNDGYLWIREILQNSLDAVKKNRGQSAEIPKVRVDTYLCAQSREARGINKDETEELDLVVEASDPVGMDLHTIINYLLIPNESNKKDDEGATGRFGQGFFTVFGDAKEVRIKTSVGDGVVQYLRITPIKDNAGKIIDFFVEMSEVSEEFKGTIIQKVMATDMPQVEAAFCRSAVVSYGGLLDRGAIELDFRGKEVNTPRTVLAEINIPRLGTVKIYDAAENALTQNGLFIKELDGELLAGIPTKLREAIEKNGIALDIPASVKLIKSRSDIAKKKEIVPLLVEYLPILVLRAYLESVVLGKAEIPNIPYDYFEGLSHRQVASYVANDAKKIASNEPLVNYERYLQDEDAFTQLLTCLPCVMMGGERISIFELANRIDRDPDSVEIDKLPPSIAEKIKYAAARKSQEQKDIETAENEYGIDDTMIMNDSELPMDSGVREEAGLYYAYDRLVRFIFSHINAAAVRPAYYLQIGQSLAHAWPASGSIGFNLYFLAEIMPDFEKIVEQKLPAGDVKVQKFLEDVIRLCTHERRHNLEGTEETQWTHNDVFFAGQREIIARLVKDKAVDFQLILDEIYSEFIPTFISAREMTERITIESLHPPQKA